jgi:hypothetical protein
MAGPIQQFRVNPISNARSEATDHEPEHPDQAEVGIEAADPLEAAIVAPVADPAGESLAAEVAVLAETPVDFTAQPPSPDRPKVSAQVMRGVRLLAAPLSWLLVVAFCGGTGVSAFFWLTTLPPLPDCKTFTFFSGDAERLHCAEQAARSGDAEALRQSLDLVKNWSADHPLHDRAKSLTWEWSKSLWTIARSKAEQNQLLEAIALAENIPPTSPLQKEAKTAIAVWQQLHSQEQSIDKPWQAALKAQDWQAVETQLTALSQRPGDYWKQYLTRARQQAAAERVAYRQLEQLRRLAASATGLELLKQAIALAEQINPTSYAYPEVQQEITRLNQNLVTVVNDRVAQGDLTGAIAAGQTLSLSVPLSAAATDAFWFSQAQPLASNQISLEPIAEQLWQLWVVVPHLEKIAPDNLLYGQAQALRSRLEAKAQDLMQLQLASSVANLKQIAAYRLAIDLAQQITLDRPQRLYGQTLIAQWRGEIQQAEDYPYLLMARQLAQTGKIPSLRGAIVLAGRISLGRSLRSEAQSAIFDWQQQIQIIEDKPTLTQAQALAKQQKLKEAIQVATKIRPGRALYKDTQVVIQTWTTQIQLAEDRPILYQAKDLANQGKLAAAIELAAQIPSGRALHQEAQIAIAQWEAQLAAIQKVQRSQTRDDRAPATELPSDRYRAKPAPTEQIPPVLE